MLSSKLVRPAYNAGAAPAAGEYIPLSVFDRVTYNMQMAIIYAFPPPAPSTAAVEKGLAAVLAEYRAFAGQLGEAPDGTPALLLNDRRALRGGSRGRRSRGHGVRQAHPGAAAPAPGPRGGPPGGAARSTELRRGGHDGGGGARRAQRRAHGGLGWRRARRASTASVGGELGGLDGPGGPRARARLRCSSSHLHPPSPSRGSRALAAAAELELAEAMACASAPRRDGNEKIEERWWPTCL